MSTASEPDYAGYPSATKTRAPSRVQAADLPPGVVVDAIKDAIALIRACATRDDAGIFAIVGSTENLPYLTAMTAAAAAIICHAESWMTRPSGRSSAWSHPNLRTASLTRSVPAKAVTLRELTALRSVKRLFASAQTPRASPKNSNRKSRKPPPAPRPRSRSAPTTPNSTRP